jgi:hypothetical protein
MHDNCQAYRAGCSPNNDLRCSFGFHRQIGDGSHSRTESATILQFVRGVRGSLHVPLEEGTWAAWWHDLLKPHVSEVLV